MSVFHVNRSILPGTVRVGGTVVSYPTFIAFLALNPGLPAYTPLAAPFVKETYAPNGDILRPGVPLHYKNDGVTDVPMDLPFPAGDAYLAAENALNTYVNNLIVLPPLTQADALNALNGRYNFIVKTDIAPFERVFDASIGISYINLQERDAKNTIDANFAALAAQIPTLVTEPDIQAFIDGLDANLRAGITFPIPRTTGTAFYLRRNEVGMPDGIPQLAANTKLDPVYQYNGFVSKILCNGAGGVQPTFALAAGFVEQLFNYGVGALNFSSAPTQEPPGIYPGAFQEKDFFDRVNGTLVERYKLGLTHRWRIRFSYSGKNVNNTVYIRIRLFNPLSAFSLPLIYPLSPGAGTATGEGALEFTSIADGASLPPLGYSTNQTSANVGTGIGYRLGLAANDAINLTITQIASLTNQPQL